MNRALFALLASVVVSSTLAESTEPTRIRITTWNLEWFPNGSAREATPEKQAQRIQATADVLKKLNPDILLLQEVRDMMDMKIRTETLVAILATAGGTTGAIDENVYSGSADNGSNFRIDSCQYVYNLSSGALGPGTYRVDILIGGSVAGRGIFGLK